MAIKEIKRFNNGLGEYVREFICDLASDLADMPKAINNVAIGSTVLCLENKTEYMLSNSDEWLEFDKKTEAYSKTEIDTMIGDIDSILDSILGV